MISDCPNAHFSNFLRPFDPCKHWVKRPNRFLLKKQFTNIRNLVPLNHANESNTNQQGEQNENLRRKNCNSHRDQRVRRWIRNEPSFIRRHNNPSTRKNSSKRWGHSCCSAPESRSLQNIRHCQRDPSELTHEPTNKETDMTIKLCNACLNVWDTPETRCPECGCDDWDECRDEDQFTGGLDDRRN